MESEEGEEWVEEGEGGRRKSSMECLQSRV